MNQGCQCFFQGESYIRQHPGAAGHLSFKNRIRRGHSFFIRTVRRLGHRMVFEWFRQFTGFAKS